MNGYILSILGIVVIGIIIDVIIPSGSINKYIKSIYAIFVVAVIISPIFKYVGNKDFSLSYQEFEIDQTLLNYINNVKVDAIENDIIAKLENDGFKGVVINIEFSSENNELTYTSCLINLENLVIAEDKSHINSYEFITEVVRSVTGLESEEIVYE